MRYAFLESIRRTGIHARPPFCIISALNPKPGVQSAREAIRAHGLRSGAGFNARRAGPLAAQPPSCGTARCCLSDPDLYCLNRSFQIKMIWLALAIAFHYAIHRKAALSDAKGRRAKLVLGASRALWAGVIAGGFFIALL